MMSVVMGYVHRVGEAVVDRLPPEAKGRIGWRRIGHADNLPGWRIEGVGATTKGEVARWVVKLRVAVDLSVRADIEIVRGTGRPVDGAKRLSAGMDHVGFAEAVARVIADATGHDLADRVPGVGVKIAGKVPDRPAKGVVVTRPTSGGTTVVEALAHALGWAEGRVADATTLTGLYSLLDVAVARASDLDLDDITRDQVLGEVTAMREGVRRLISGHTSEEVVAKLPEVTDRAKLVAAILIDAMPDERAAYNRLYGTAASPRNPT